MIQTITLNQVYEELKRIEENMIAKEELNGLLETVEILSNKNTMEQIKKSEKDIRYSKVKEIKFVGDI